MSGAGLGVYVFSLTAAPLERRFSGPPGASRAEFLILVFLL